MRINYLFDSNSYNNINITFNFRQNMGEKGGDLLK